MTEAEGLCRIRHCAAGPKRRGNPYCRRTSDCAAELATVEQSIGYCGHGASPRLFGSVNVTESHGIGSMTAKVMMLQALRWDRGLGNVTLTSSGDVGPGGRLHC